MAIRHETASYRLASDRFGNYTLTRKTDGASAYFQGDEATLWDRNMDAIEGIERRGAWGTANTLDGSFDFLCQGYDDILEAPPKLKPASASCVIPRAFDRVQALEARDIVHSLGLGSV